MVRGSTTCQVKVLKVKALAFVAKCDFCSKWWNTELEVIYAPILPAPSLQLPPPPNPTPSLRIIVPTITNRTACIFWLVRVGTLSCTADGFTHNVGIDTSAILTFIVSWLEDCWVVISNTIIITTCERRKSMTGYQCFFLSRFMT